MRFPRVFAVLLSLGSVGLRVASADDNLSDLFADAELTGWQFVTPEPAALASVCEVNAQHVVAVKGKPVGYLQTAGSFENFRLHAEWRWTGKPGNGGILVHIASGPVDRNTWPRSFQVQLKHTGAGDLLPMAGVGFLEPAPATKPGAPLQRVHTAPDSEKPVGEWNSCDVICRGSTIEVTVNGVLQNRVTQCKPSSGRVGFQLEGTPFELRNVRLEPLDL